MLSPIRRIVFDCKNPQLLADFWASVTGYNKIDDDVSYSMLGHPEKIGPYLLFFVNPDEKTVKNRVHVELNAVDLAAEVARVTELGGQKVAEHSEHGFTWCVMADPEGNEFCILHTPTAQS